MSRVSIFDGTWKNFHTDGGVVVHRKNEYIIVGLIEHPEGGEGLSELVVLVDNLMEKMQCIPRS